MRVLVISGFPATDADRHLVDVALIVLAERGHQPTLIDLVADGFTLAMTAGERAAYHQEENLVSDETRRSAALVGEVDALVFCYPTVTHSVPAIVKGWCERVLLPGVAFVFDDKGRIARGMTNITRLGVITVTPHGRLARWRHRDLGYRTIMRTIRMNCHARCRRTFVRLHRGTAPDESAAAVSRAFSRW
jgi:putative NADPH-quinone reductase